MSTRMHKIRRITNAVSRRGRGVRPAWEPTPEEIAERAAEIRKEWSAETHGRRALSRTPQRAHALFTPMPDEAIREAHE